MTVMDRETIHKRLDAWLDELAAKLPSADDGEEHVFHLVGSRIGYGETDEEIVGFVLTTSCTEAGL